MYKSIFVPLSSHGDQSAALSFAAALADVLHAGCDCIFASKTLSLLSPEQRWKIGDVLVQEGYEASMKMEDRLYREQYQQRAKAAQGWFNEKTAGLKGGKRLLWRDSPELFGDSAEQMRDECAFHDMTIASFDLGASIHDDVITGALFGSARPIALVRSFAPDRKLEDMTVTLAFKQTPQMLRAQWHALPVLTRAKRVVLACAGEGDGDKSAGLDRFAAYLAKHGVKSEIHRIKDSDDPAQALENYHIQQGGDLLVMGAWSHSRMSELVFGGFTRHFLTKGTCNLFLAH